MRTRIINASPIIYAALIAPAFAPLALAQDDMTPEQMRQRIEELEREN